MLPQSCRIDVGMSHVDIFIKCFRVILCTEIIAIDIPMYIFQRWNESCPKVPTYEVGSIDMVIL